MIKKFIRLSLFLIAYSILFTKLNIIETSCLLFVAAIIALIFNNKINKILEIAAYMETMNDNNSKNN